MQKAGRFGQSPVSHLFLCIWIAFCSVNLFAMNPFQTRRRSDPVKKMVRGVSIPRVISNCPRSILDSCPWQDVFKRLAPLAKRCQQLKRGIKSVERTPLLIELAFTSPCRVVAVIILHLLLTGGVYSPFICTSRGFHTKKSSWAQIVTLKWFQVI